MTFLATELDRPQIIYVAKQDIKIAVALQQAIQEMAK